MAIRALMLFGNTDWQTWLESNVGVDSHVVRSDADDLVAGREAVRDAGRIDLLFICLDTDSAVTPALTIEALVEVCADVPCIGLVDGDQAEIVLGALRAGAADVFVRGRDDERIASLSARALKRPGTLDTPSSKQPPSRGGHVVSLVSAAQSPLLAYSMVHMGTALRESVDTDNARVLLIDLSLPGGDSTILFEAGADFGVLDVLRDIERCDDTLIDSAFPMLDSGCHLLALPEQLDAIRLVDELDDIARLMDISRSYFDYTIICGDAGMGLDALGALTAGSDRALLISDQSVLRSRQSKALLSALSSAGQDTANLDLMIVDYRAQAGIDSERLASLLDLPLEATVGGRGVTRLEAMNLGKSMFEHAPSDGFSTGIRALTARLFDIEQGERQSTGLAGRLQRLWRG